MRALRWSMVSMLPLTLLLLVPALGRNADTLVAGDAQPAPAGAAVAVKDGAAVLHQLMGQDEFQRCGLDELQPEQLNALVGWWMPVRGSDYTTAAALAYLERHQDFQRVVLGPARRVDPNSSLRGYRQTAVVGGELVVLQPGAAEQPLPPGMYLAKVHSLSWIEVLDLYGDDVSYSQAR